MPSQELMNLAAYIDNMVNCSEEDSVVLKNMSANLRAIAEQVTQLEALPLAC